MKRYISIFLILIMLIGALDISIFADYDTNNGAEIEDSYISSVRELDLEAKSAVLMEAESGVVLYAKNKDEAYSPASVTKTMTLLLCAEALERGDFKLSDKVTVSSSATAMGGSQVFLKEGEEMTVEDLLKSTVIASANDCAVAIAELIAGSESAFVDKMNERAGELGLRNTVFENCTGLDDTTTNHVMSAYDIALISRELIKHECILNYSNVWQDSIRNGEFTLTNTNRLVRYYSGCTGLKTGSTDKAGFCVSATAKRDGMHLIAVIMGAETREKRNEAARELLDFGFANFSLFSEEKAFIEDIPVYSGRESTVPLYSSPVSFLLEKGDAKKIEKKYVIPDYVKAPVKEGDIVGEIIYTVEDREVGKSNIVTGISCDKINMIEIFRRIFLDIIKG